MQGVWLKLARFGRACRLVTDATTAALREPARRTRLRKQIIGNLSALLRLLTFSAHNRARGRSRTESPETPGRMEALSNASLIAENHASGWTFGGHDGGRAGAIAD